MPAYDDVVEAYRRALSDGRLTELPLTGYDRTGIPVVATVYDAPDGTDAHGVGYGATEGAARVGAYGELAERVLLDPVLAALPSRRAAYADLAAELGADHVADPLTLVLPAGSSYAADGERVWLPTTRWPTGEEVWVPAELVASSPAQLAPHGPPPPGGWLTTPITNGLGAGDGATRAVGHGLLELLQRDGDTVAFRALDAGVVIDVDAAAGAADGVVRETLDRLRREGVEPLVKLAATDPVCVVYCVGRDDHPAADPMAVGAVGEAAHPDRDVAIGKALLEYAASRARRVFAFGSLERVERLSPAYLAEELRRPLGEQEPRALAAMTAWSRLDAESMRELLDPVLLRRRTTVSPLDLPAADDLGPADLLEELSTRLRRTGLPAPLVVLGERAGMVAAKVVVPGLEVETVSYLRLGERVAARLLAAGSDLVGRGAPDRPSRLPVRVTTAAEERLGGPVWLDREAVETALRGPVAGGPDLYPLYREPRRHAVQRLAAVAGRPW